MVHLDSTWSSCELHVDYGHKFGRATTKVKCTWSPGGLQKIHLDSGGVHLEKVGQGKVLGISKPIRFVAFEVFSLKGIDIEPLEPSHDSFP